MDTQQLQNDKLNIINWITELQDDSLIEKIKGLMRSSKGTILTNEQKNAIDQAFESIHQKSVLLELNVIRKFQTILIGKFPDLPEALLKKFARTRTFLRIRALNAKLKDIDIEKSWKQRQKKIAQFKN